MSKIKPSSKRWLDRQAKDIYVKQSKKDGYRSRAAYKLIEIHEKYNLFKPGHKVVDLGAAPGSWSQVVLEKITTSKKRGQLIGIDLLPIQPLPDSYFIQGDFQSEEVRAQLSSLIQGGGLQKEMIQGGALQEKMVQKEMIQRGVNSVLSDMAPSTIGHAKTDHLRILHLCELAWDFAENFLMPGGHFVSKIFQGGAAADFLGQLKQKFEKVVHMKPKASRPESTEIYLIALFKKA